MNYKLLTVFFFCVLSETFAMDLGSKKVDLAIPGFNAGNFLSSFQAYFEAEKSGKEYLALKCQEMRELPEIIELSIDGDLDSNWWSNLLELIPWEKLRSLDLTGHVIGQLIIWDAHALGPLIEVYTRGRSLTSYTWPHGNHHNGAPELFYKLAESKSLEFLNLSKNAIGDIGISSCASWIFPNVTLTTLNLCQCHITDKGAKFLWQALHENLILKSLNLEGNFITFTFEMGISLSHHLTLEDINLSNNKIDDNGAIGFSRILNMNHVIKCLYLHGNQISEVGAQFLINYNILALTF